MSRLVRACRISTLTLAAVLGLMAEAVVYGQPALAIDDLHVGDCQVVVRPNGVPAGDKVGVIVEFSELTSREVVDGASLKFVLPLPLQRGFVVRARLNGEDIAAAVVPPSTGNTLTRGVCTLEVPLYASAFVGTLFDVEAGDNIVVGEQLRTTFGVASDYRLAGNQDSKAELWVNAQIVHGVRTINVACGGSAEVSSGQSCPSSPSSATAPTATIVNSSSLEAFVAPRLEFGGLGVGTDIPLRFLVASHVGLIAIHDEPRTFWSTNVALGMVATQGVFAGSSAEVGWGKNELYSPRWTRLQVNAILAIDLLPQSQRQFVPRIFVEMLADRDLQRVGLDNIRTFVGVGIDLTRALRSDLSRKR